ncbi:GbsR/MarR family transcriptional regulator [Aureibacillus halotolerans]|uniref:HTH-type transcriptional regulator n=1 Tax=Aureibacillus halotolerans TaxID=1508390 RepID=A0A4R6TSB9_9BACI|nr:MarR family transcriptional regulator [Aureibacillus halotolerans]TDQ35387.1 DNA-binding transcriptional regulator GbsR (MarR family) [Aureibacillus halotolerans]
MSNDTNSTFDVSPMNQLTAHWLQIYGLTSSEALVLSTLYSHNTPKTNEDLCTMLGLSTTTASKNLRILVDKNLVKKTWVKGFRKAHFSAERDLFKQFQYAFADPLRSQIHSYIKRLEDIGANVENDSNEQTRILSLLTFFEEMDRRIEALGKLNP